MSLVLLVSFKIILLWTARSSSNAFLMQQNKTKLMTHILFGGSWYFVTAKLVPGYVGEITQLTDERCDHYHESPNKVLNICKPPQYFPLEVHNFWRKFTESHPPWKIDGWKTILSFLGPVYFQGNLAVSFSEGISSQGTNHISIVRDILYTIDFPKTYIFNINTNEWNVWCIPVYFTKHGCLPTPRPWWFLPQQISSLLWLPSRVCDSMAFQLWEKLIPVS